MTKCKWLFCIVGIFLFLAACGRETAEMIKKYLEQGLIETIHSTEPNLESVFMELTGRQLV